MNVYGTQSPVFSTFQQQHDSQDITIPRLVSGSLKVPPDGNSSLEAKFAACFVPAGTDCLFLFTRNSHTPSYGLGWVCLFLSEILIPKTTFYTVFLSVFVSIGSPCA